MKRFLVFILAFIYLASSAGAMVHLHYCKGELVDIQVGKKEKSPCSGCKSAEKSARPCMKDCCKDEHRMMKLEKDHQQSGDIHFRFIQPFFHALTVPFIELPGIFLNGREDFHPNQHAPPLHGSVQLHLLHCQFRI